MTILTIIDIATQVAGASQIPTKATTAYNIAEVKRFIYEVGRTYAIIPSDQEPAIMAILREVAKSISGISLRKIPQGDSQAQGSVERLHGTLAGQIKIFRITIENNYGIDKIKADDRLMPWIVRHSIFVLNRYHVHADGKTSYQRRWLRSYQSPLCEFGETIMFKVAPGNPISDKKFETK